MMTLETTETISMTEAISMNVLSYSTQCEVTEEMLEAGVDAFYRIDCVEDSPQEIVREIYQAMVNCWQK